MSDQAIQSSDITVAGVFQSFYVVPDYQREYVWGTEEVQQLLGDINAELSAADPLRAPEYFIGSIVVCPGESGVLDLIDGQQRMTTLFLTLCAIRDRLTELGQKSPGALEPQIAATSTDPSGKDQFRYRLDLQYEDSGNVLVELAQGQLDGTGTPGTRSIANIRNAYETALSFLRSEFASDADLLRVFYGYLTNKVKLIRIQTEDVAKALKIFETINDRGVGLDAMDLLKNLLFMKASPSEFETLKGTWKSMQDTIYGMKEKPLRFLRYFIFSRYDVDLLREDEIYGWLAANEPKCGYGKKPLAFADELLEAARSYRNFLDGKDVAGDRNRYLENLQLLGGKAARQHLILLLAGRHLPRPLFDRLAREVEELFFVYVITREATRDFERDFARWATELRRVNDETALLALIDKRFAPAKAALSLRFDEAFARLSTLSVQAYRLRYVIGKLTQQVELAAYGETTGTRWLSRFTSPEFEIEHIYPQQPCAEAQAEFGVPTDALISQRLGNLLLVEKSINASLGNKPYSRKVKIYPHSQLLLTRAMSARPQVGSNTKIDKALASVQSFADWNESTVTERQSFLASLARRAWNVSSSPPLPAAARAE